MIEVTIRFDYYDGVIEVKRDSSLMAGYEAPSVTLKALVASVEASAIAAMRATPDPARLKS